MSKTISLSTLCVVAVPCSIMKNICRYAATTIEILYEDHHKNKPDDEPNDSSDRLNRAEIRVGFCRVSISGSFNDLF